MENRVNDKSVPPTRDHLIGTQPRQSQVSILAFICDIFLQLDLELSAGHAVCKPEVFVTQVRPQYRENMLSWRPSPTKQGWKC